MSQFVRRKIRCPHCDDVVERDIALSVNASRTPAHREAILAERFQCFACRYCGQHYQVDDTLMYVDFQRQHWIGMFPAAWEADWPDYVDQPGQAFHDSLAGPDAPAVARALADGFVVRAVFGLAALREKLLCFAAGLDDALLEALKLDLVRGHGELSLAPSCLPRLAEVTADELRFRVLVPDIETPEAPHPGSAWRAELRVPRQAYHDLAQRAAEQAPTPEGSPWHALLDELGRAAYVDLGRILMSRAPAVEPA